MRGLCVWAVALSLTASPVVVMAKRRAEDSPAPAKTSVAVAVTADTSSLEAEIDELRSLLQSQGKQLQDQSEQLIEQDKKMQALEEQVKAGSAMAAPADATANQSIVAALSPAAPAAVASTPAAAQAATGVDVAKQIEDRVRQIGPFTFSGDFRLRQEPFIGGPPNRSLVRYRLRYRARLNLNAKLNDDFSGGISLASGDVNSPITTNQTANQDFTRKPFLLDRAFFLYTPHQFKPLSIVGGKFAYPWYRTELTWDNDVNPEGVAETLNFKLDKTPILKRIALVGFQLPFSETKGINGNNVPANEQSTHVSVVYGGQVQSEWQLAAWLKLTADAAFYNWHNADPVAFALQTANSASPGNGTLPLSVGTVQHSITIWKNAAGAVVNAQFASKFGLFDTIMRFDIKTPSAKWPLIVLGDYVQNTKACSNAVNFFAPAGSTVSSTAACNPHQRHAYWLESRVGRNTEQHDLQFAYTRMFIEREAVLGVFNFDDMRATSNVTQHRLEVFYNLYRNVTLGFTGLIGRPLNTTEPYLKRLQGDLIYRF